MKIPTPRFFPPVGVVFFQGFQTSNLIPKSLMLLWRETHADVAWKPSWSVVTRDFVNIQEPIKVCYSANQGGLLIEGIICWLIFMSCVFVVVGFVNSLPSLGTVPSYVMRSWSYSLTFLLGEFWDTWTGSAAVDEHLSIERDETRYCFANEPSKTVSFTSHLRPWENALCSHAQTQLSLVRGLIPESSCTRGMFPVRMYILRITTQTLLVISIFLATFTYAG